MEADLMEGCKSYHSDEIEDETDDNAFDSQEINTQYLYTNESIMPNLSLPKILQKEFNPMSSRIEFEVSADSPGRPLDFLTFDMG